MWRGVAFGDVLGVFGVLCLVICDKFLSLHDDKMHNVAQRK